MSVELKLLVQSGADIDNTHSCNTIICIKKDNLLFSQINALPTRKVEKPVYSNGIESSFGVTTRFNPYGYDLYWINAGDCSELESNYTQNKAALAYLAALDKDTMVVFYWY